MNKSTDIIRPYSVENVGGQVGSAETNVTVTVNTNTATRQDYYWYHRLEVDNLYTAAYPQVVVEAVYDPGTNEPYIVSSETGNVFVAASPEEFTYDDDGNLLSDGRFEYAWDCENRLISATTTTNLPAETPIVHVQFEYDYMSRRVGKTVYEWDAGVTNWSLLEARQNVYNGWALIQEEVSGDAVTTNWYLHGLDLSGSLTGAGGVGGLLAATFGTNTCAYAFDGNGNVSELINIQTGELMAHYQYSPFGETIVATGELAQENKFRFSTKPAEDNTGLVLYEHRPYSPSLARFLNKDPIGEWGGVNVYSFVFNNPLYWIDPYGLQGNCSSLPAMEDGWRRVTGRMLRACSQMQYAFDSMPFGDEGYRAGGSVGATGADAVAAALSRNPPPEAWSTSAEHFWGSGLPADSIVGGGRIAPIGTPEAINVISAAGAFASLYGAYGAAEQAGSNLGSGQYAEGIHDGASATLGGYGAASGLAAGLKGSLANPALASFAGAVLSWDLAFRNITDTELWRRDLHSITESCDRMRQLAREYRRRIEKLREDCCQ